ncbi:MAG TPA: chemotaxis protein CheW [Leptospiraceae bacterium]|nr:chemotaxis protein CheW [Spirochaetaceae bacterium]HBS06314.1 chemotaxis protein CheW [Leptospiraceae bacterium]|tara:strand:+ start:41719 stop:42249 length:531 start_codon:yes stop_codon:yes gene_type:complete
MSDLDIFDEEDDLEEEELLTDKYLSFALGDRHFAVPVAAVIEMVAFQDYTELPEMPDFVIGVINLRGRIIPLFDLRIRFSMDTVEYTERTCIIIAEVQGKLVGLVVDAILDVEYIPEDEVRPAPSFEGDAISEFVNGIGKTRDQVRILLNLEDLLRKLEKRDLDQLKLALENRAEE